MRKLVVLFSILAISISSFAQYGFEREYTGPERYFYDEDFDWRWDVRVRISDGIQSGLLTRREANRLYNRLESIESREFAYQADGFYSAWEQDEIWNEVVWLNRRLGLELRDGDRRYYGYSLPGVAFRGYLPWYFGNRYDFYRFDNRGFGSITLGYAPRFYYPRNHYYYNPNRFGANNWNNNRNDRYRNDRRVYENRRNDNYRNVPRDSNRNSERYNQNSGRSQDTRPNRSDERQRGDVYPQRNVERGNSGSSNRERNSSIGRSENRDRSEIQTPRGQGSRSESGNNRGEGRSSRSSTPDRGKANDSSRGRNVN